MTKIYTPQAWFSLFDNPVLYIEDDGLIYSEDEYYKTLRQACGKIDYETGFIYGKNYHRLSEQPIGKIVTRDSDGVRLIYGPDYYRLSAQPILYIRGNAVYDASEFHKLFPMEAGYVQSDGAPLSGSSDPSPARRTYTSGGTFSRPKKKPEDPSLMKIILTVLVILALLIAGAYYVLTDSEYSLPSIIMLSVGTVAALIFAKEWMSAVVTILCVTGVQMFIYDYISTTSHKTLGVGELILSIIVYPFAIILTYAIPAVILGTGVWLIKRPFQKKKEKENADSEDKNKS